MLHYQAAVAVDVVAVETVEKKTDTEEQTVEKKTDTEEQTVEKKTDTEEQRTVSDSLGQPRCKGEHPWSCCEPRFLF